MELESEDLPVVSVVIPLYNKERHIRRAIESVLGQSEQRFEIVVIDDGSSDGSGAVVQTIADARIRFYRQANQGVSAARNRGIDVARADLIAFLDADDAYGDGFLEHILSLARDYPSAGAYALNYRIVHSPDRIELGVSPAVERRLLDPAAFFAIGKFGTPVFSSSVAVSRSAIDRAGRFPVGVKLGEDIDTWLRICFVAPIAYDSRPGGIYFLDAQQRACDLNPPPLRHVFFDTIDRWAAAQPHLSAGVRQDIAEFKNFFVLAHARHQIRWGDVATGRRVLYGCRTKTFRVWKWRLLVSSLLPKSLLTAISRLRAAI